MEQDFWKVYIRGRKYYSDIRRMPVGNSTQTVANIFSIGGTRGWYYANWLWNLRGWADKLVGGPGMRGRKHPTTLHPGDNIDFWKVVIANPQQGILLLEAEMKIPGEAWLLFVLRDNNLTQTAVYVPDGIAGELYWWSVWPFHGFIFPGMIRRLISFSPRPAAVD
ncbi:Protein of unknown function [Chitinophaga jiangningensis]|uniref:DUF2867 domain-containing protein n=1 Tax=Chitinophaga jiangningensis TaxID=1419482 RepID=A0A1M7L327_9BACT|nr:DUF2867 domain-containing protein [Chitinophaga jiangningensis]SHM72365.1 Protein of unknown function [Chitinophaga jiangningensis]